MRKLKKEQEVFENDVEILLSNPEVEKMESFIQHGNVSCLKHCIAVAYYSFSLCNRLKINVDCHGLIRGAMLHDFFLYDWHKRSNDEDLHGFSHPKTALHNAKRIYDLNEIEEDIIVKHMWPLTIIPPACKESFIVCMVDKFCSIIETMRLNSIFSLKGYNEQIKYVEVPSID